MDALTGPQVVPPSAAEAALRGYYAWHAQVYDATRWTFLFGRHRLMEEVAKQGQPEHIHEVGCGTGVNLARLARRFPNATLTGWDGSADMLARAQRRLAFLGGRCQLRPEFFRGGSCLSPAPDLVVFSYCLSMIHADWESVVDAACRSLAPGGLLAVVDFHGSPFPWFRRWMGLHHVRMERHLLPRLRAAASPLVEAEVRTWGGLWEYFLFVGRSPDAATRSVNRSETTALA